MLLKKLISDRIGFNLSFCIANNARVQSLVVGSGTVVLVSASQGSGERFVVLVSVSYA